VRCKPGRLKIFEKDNVDEVISSYWIPYRTPRIFEYHEGYVYLVQGHDGIWIFDVSNPQEIRLAGILDITIASNARIEIKENKLFLVSTWPSSLVILSLDNPEEPREKSRCSLPEEMGTGLSVRVVDDRIYVLCSDGLVIFDVQVPSEANLIKTISFEDELNKVFVRDDIIYLGFLKGKLCSCILENDMTLTNLDEIELAATEWGFIMDICFEGDFLYAALNADGIASVDIEDPYNMQVYARFNTSQFSEQIKVFNSYAYVADGSGGIVVVDMLTKGLEKEIASYPTADWTRAIAISDGYVYTCEGDNGVTIFASDLLNVK